MYILSAETGKMYSFQSVANLSYQAMLLFKSYMTVNTGPCGFSRMLYLSGLVQLFIKDNLRSFYAIPLLLLVSKVNYGINQSLPTLFWQVEDFSVVFQIVHTAAIFWQM